MRALDYGPVPAEPGNRGQKNYENLLLTGTFESGTDGWTLDEGAALSSEQYRNGGQSLKLEGAEAVFVDSPVVTLSPYRNYVVQAWVYKSAPDDAFALVCVRHALSYGRPAGVRAGRAVASGRPGLFQSC